MEEVKNKRILLTTGIFPPDIGGPATYAETLCDELPKRGFEVKVVTYGNGKKLEIGKLGNWEIGRISRKQNILLRYFKFFWQTWKSAGWADIVYTQDAVNAGLPTCLACFLRGKNFFLKVVGDYAWEQGRQRFGVRDNLDEFQNKKYDWRAELFRRIQRGVARRAAMIVTPSMYLKNIVKKWGIDDKRITVIYNAVKRAEASFRGKDEIKRELGLTGDIILSAGRLVPWKGFGTLIDLMPELLEVNPEFKLVVIGEGPELESYKLQVISYKLQKHVILLGAVRQEVLWKYMSAADMFALNTGYEGLPHITIEAMQLSLPVITTRAGGNTEVITDGETGLLVDYDDKAQLKNAILRLWQDKELAERLAGAARASVGERFGKERMVGEITSLFK